jgi:hypothetical protein
MRASTYFPLAPLIVVMFVDSTIAVQTTCFQVSEIMALCTCGPDP